MTGCVNSSRIVRASGWVPNSTNQSMKAHNQELQNKQFLSFLFGGVSDERMKRTFRQRNVVESKYLVYQRFILALIDNVYETYLGSDCIYKEADIVGHFKWCFLKTSVDLKDTRYKFEENKELYEYFLEYFRLNLYMCEDSRENDYAYFRSFFHMEGNMKNCDLSSFLDLYEIFDKTQHRGRNLVTSR